MRAAYTPKKKLINDEGEVRELTSQDIRKMRAAHEVLPTDLLSVLSKHKKNIHPSSKTTPKVSITMRCSPEVIHYFKSYGANWERLMDKALKEWIVTHKDRS